ALRTQRDRRPWPLAAASPGPAETVAAALEATADRARQRGGYAAAARALERAAQLSPEPADRARRLALGADAATFTGQLGWVQELAARVPADTSDPAVLALAAHSTGWALSQTTRHRAALAVLLPAAASGGQNAAVALVNAALTAYHSGEEPARRDVLRAASRMPLAADNPWRIWIVAATDPFGQREELLESLAKARTDNPLELGALGAAAWTLDETAQAIDLLEAAIDGRRAAGALGGRGAPFVPRGRAYADQGRWAEPETAAAPAAAIAAEGQVELVAAGTLALEASLLAVRGDTAAARDKAAAALAAIDPRQSRAIARPGRPAAAVAGTPAAGPPGPAAAPAPPPGPPPPRMATTSWRTSSSAPCSPATATRTTFTEPGTRWRTSPRRRPVPAGATKPARSSTGSPERSPEGSPPGWSC
ncbi:hypothetical protein K1W54_31480, partial [Micromonospora sp. CPCC 205371]|nr:hypothetical protein [Micromonospora sp. CPCC 205371]